MARSGILLCAEGDGGVRAMKIVSATLASLLLAGCNSGDLASGQAQVPAAIEKMMGAEFPADGQIHVKAHGAFEIKPETMFCRHTNGLMVEPVAVSKLFKELGQPTTLKSGYPRANGKIGFDPECELSRQLFVKGIQASNRQNKPYKLVLAVWQGDVAAGLGGYWVGGVERLEGNYPIEGRSFHPGDKLEAFGEDNVTKTIEFDVRQLSQNFVKHIVKGAAK